MHFPTEPASSSPLQLIPAKRRLPAILLSVALHAGVLGLAAYLGTMARNRFIEPTPFQTLALLDTAGGSHAVRIELPPSDFAAHTRTPTKDPDTSHKTPLPVEQSAPKMSGGGAPKAPHAGDGAGQAVIGNGSDNDDVHPAFPTFSPKPPVTNRALLPAVEKKIVVDVEVDVLGQVVHETLVKGIGNQLDQIVLDTVRTWKFQPATVNGKPVPTQDELIFPFNPSYPITDS